MVLQAYSASSSVKNSQNPNPWCAMEIRSLGKCTLTWEGYQISTWAGDIARAHTNWTGLKHEFPYERIGASLVEVSLYRDGRRRLGGGRTVEGRDVRDTRWLPGSGHPGVET
jgi:hypothetical protein